MWITVISYERWFFKEPILLVLNLANTVREK
jgi:hypothetical protein